MTHDQLRAKAERIAERHYAGFGNSLLARDRIDELIDFIMIEFTAPEIEAATDGLLREVRGTYDADAAERFHAVAKRMDDKLAIAREERRASEERAQAWEQF